MIPFLQRDNERFTMNWILASKSPRRKALLALVHAPFLVRGADIDETLRTDCSIQEAVADLSCRKARAVRRESTDIVIAADTVVVLDGEILGKPKDAQDAFRMLSALSGKGHQVMTGLTVLRGEKTVCHTQVTDIYFRKLTEQEIWDYIATGDPMDKAGAYGIQNGAAVFVEKICGDYFNVVGLPVCKLKTIIMEEFQ